MKLNNPISRDEVGMTLLELTVVILVLLSLITILFIGARAWKKGSDRSANIMNIRNCQQAMRGEQNMKQLSSTSPTPFTQTQLERFTPYPAAINADIGAYGNKGIITPESGTALDPTATDWAHIWLEPGIAGMPDDLGGTGYGHNRVADTSGW